MNKISLWKKIKYAIQFIPFTLNTILWIAGLVAVYFLIKPNNKEVIETSAFASLMLLMLKIALWFVALLLLLSFLGTFICWLHYLIVSNKESFNVQFKNERKKSNRYLMVEAVLKKARRPVLGFIKGRLIYDNLQMTDQFVLASNKKTKGKFWRDGISGKNELMLPDIKDYTITGAIVYFEDMLRIFSLPIKAPITGHFYRAPENIKDEAQTALPRKTDQTDVRIEELRKVEGEMLNYKDFESGDDVRRIVWKVYAKNRELVVKIPETLNPYSSHIYFYASFYTKIPSSLRENKFAAEMLNYYKNYVWTLYETLTKKEFEVKYIADQFINIPEESTPEQMVLKTISNSNWHSEKDTQSYFESKYGSVLCISSFSKEDDIANLLASCSRETTVYYIKLSSTFKSFAPFAWLSRIFLQPPNDRLKRIRSRWVLSPFRYKITKQEKAIEQILSKAEANIVEIV